MNLDNPLLNFKIGLMTVIHLTCMGPFKCYVNAGGGGVRFPGKVALLALGGGGYHGSIKKSVT